MQESAGQPETPRPFRIALGHQARVGKDTFVERAVARSGGYVLSFAGPLYDLVGAIQTFAGVPVVKDPTLLQRTGMLMRGHYGDDFWIRKMSARIDAILAREPNAHIYITDVRFKNEFAFVRERGFTTVKITRPGRLIDRDPNHISEIDLADAPFDYHIINNSWDDFMRDIDHTLEDIAAGPRESGGEVVA